MPDLALREIGDLVLTALFVGAKEDAGHIDASGLSSFLGRHVSATQIELAATNLENSGLIHCSYSALSPTQYKITPEGYTYVQNELKDPTSIQSRFTKGGMDFLLEPEEEDETPREILEEPDHEAVPASDRYVTIDHNSPEYEEAKEALEEVIEGIEGDNDFPEGEEKQPYRASLSSGLTLLEFTLISWNQTKLLIVDKLDNLKKIVRTQILANAIDRALDAVKDLFKDMF